MKTYDAKHDGRPSRGQISSKFSIATGLSADAAVSLHYGVTNLQMYQDSWYIYILFVGFYNFLEENLPL